MTGVVYGRVYTKIYVAFGIFTGIENTGIVLLRGSERKFSVCLMKKSSGRPTLLHLFVYVKGHAKLLGFFIVRALTVAFAATVPLTAIPAFEEQLGLVAPL